MKIAITRKDEGVKEMECEEWCIRECGALSVYVLKGKVCDLAYACADWLDVEVVDE